MRFTSKKLNFTINSFHCNVKSREIHLFHLDMCIYLICLYYETLEMHLFSRHAKKMLNNSWYSVTTVRK